MKVDKRSGIWNFKEATDLDMLAYYLYTQKTKIEKSKHHSLSYMEQKEFCKDYKLGKSYKEATVLLRRLKIEKIRNGRIL